MKRLALISTLALALVAGASSGRATGGAPPGKIVAAGDDGIYVVNADGSGLRRVTSGEEDGEPRWSPDGKTIAFIRDYESVYLVAPDGSGLHRIGASEIGPLEWSPDGTRIAYAGCGGFCIEDVRTQTLVKVAAHEPPWGVAWSPDGRTIAYGGKSLYLADAATGKGTIVELTREIERPWRPSWSPDGTRIAFLDDEFRVWLYAPAEGTATRVAPEIGASTPAWSPDSSRLVFVGGDGAVHVLTLAGGEDRKLTAGPFSADDVRSAGDGAVFTSERVANGYLGDDVWIVSADGAARAVTRSFPTGIGYEEPDWSAGSVPAAAAPATAPTLRAQAASTLTHDRAVVAVAAAGDGAVFGTIDCGPNGSWTPGRSAGFVKGVCGDGWTLAGAPGVVAWVYAVDSHGEAFAAAVAGAPGGKPVELMWRDHTASADLGNLHGDGRSLVFQTIQKQGPTTLWRVVAGTPKPKAVKLGTAPREEWVVAVDGARIAMWEPGGRIVLRDFHGRTLKTLPPVAGKSKTVFLDRNELAIQQGYWLYVYDASTGKLRVRRPLSPRSGDPAVQGVRGNAAVYVSGVELHLLRLDTGADRIVELPDAAAVSAAVSPRGVFVAYDLVHTERPGRVALFPWSALAV